MRFVFYKDLMQIFGLKRNGKVVKRIWIDGSFLSNQTGIGRDARKIISDLGDSLEIKILDWPGQASHHRKLIRRLLNVTFVMTGHFFSIPDKYQGTFYQPQLNSIIPGQGISKWIVRLHDIFPLTNPEWFHWWAVILFRRSLQNAVKRNAIFLCSSNFTRLAMENQYPESRGRIKVYPCKVETLTTNKCERCLGCIAARNIDNMGEYIIAVGTIEPRKNYEFLLTFWEEKIGQGLELPKLIVVGKPGWKSRRVLSKLKRGHPEKIAWLMQCCDGSLSTLYGNAQAFISASQSEGFNLPALEARVLFKLLLILSDIPVHREVHGNQAHYFDNSSELFNILSNLTEASLPPSNLSREHSSDELRKIFRT